MGVDLIAIMKYPGLTERVTNMLDLLERFPTRRALEEMDITWPELLEPLYEFEDKPHADWVMFIEPQEIILSQRPELPNLETHLALPGAIDLVFGADSILVWSLRLTRWRVFLWSHPVQEWVQNALTALCEAFGATECIVAYELHPVERAFYEGLSFEEILKNGSPASLDELHDLEYWRLPLKD